MVSVELSTKAMSFSTNQIDSRGHQNDISGQRMRKRGLNPA